MGIVFKPAFVVLGLAVLLGLLIIATVNPVHDGFAGAVRLDNQTSTSTTQVDTKKPTLVGAFSGVGYDSVGKKLTLNNLTKLLIVFDDNLSNLDPASISTADFQVTAPSRSVIAADWFDADDVTSTAPGLETLVVRRSVFLTLGGELGPGDAPVVKLLGNGVDDEAGNTQDTGERTASSMFTLDPPGLLVAKTGAPNPVVVGDSLTYIVTTANVRATTANAVTLTDALPTGVDYVAATSTQGGGGCALTGTVTCNLGTLNPGALVTTTIQVTVSASAMANVSNAAWISDAQTDAYWLSNTSTAITTVHPFAGSPARLLRR